MRRFPAKYQTPFIFPFTPLPGTDVKSVTAAGVMEFFCAYSRMASASGCSLFFSSPAAIFKNSLCPSSVSTSVTTGFPWVMVPVLSRTTQSMLWAVSSASPDLIRIPFSAPFPVPTIIATGVASPSAQGQEITRTLMAQDRANSTPAPQASHTIAVTSAIAMTTGTNTPAILSAILAMGALLALASSTRRIIWEKVVSLPTRVALKRIKPVLFMVAAMTVSLTCLCTGMLSPVIAASSTLVLPSTINPSAGMLLPGRTTRMSPTCTCSTGISLSTPPRSTTAVFGARSRSFVIASLVFPLERVSRYFPTVISARIMAADSK